MVTQSQMAMEDRIARLELWREQAEIRFEQLNRELRDNTLMTAAVKKDTEELVTLFRASKTNLGILKWLASLAAALTAVYAAWRHVP